MRAHVIKDGKVANTIEVESLTSILGLKLIDAAAGGQAGDSYNEATKEFTSPVVADPAPPPESIPMLNLQLALIDDGKLVQAEAIIAEMPGDDGLRARAYWARALTARLDNEVVGLLWPQLYGNEDEFQAAWRRAAEMNP
jgi:hypothetical protein